MIVTTSFQIEGKEISEYMGMVRGITVRMPKVKQSFKGAMHALKNLGGDIPQFAEVCEQGREAAYNKMVDSAKSMGADAIIGVQYDSSPFQSDAIEILCYGTAVKLKS